MNDAQISVAIVALLAIVSVAFTVKTEHIALPLLVFQPLLLFLAEFALTGRDVLGVAIYDVCVFLVFIPFVRWAHGTHRRRLSSSFRAALVLFPYTLILFRIFNFVIE